MKQTLLVAAATLLLLNMDAHACQGPEELGVQGTYPNISAGVIAAQQQFGSRYGGDGRGHQLQLKITLRVCFVACAVQIVTVTKHCNETFQDAAAANSGTGGGGGSGDGGTGGTGSGGGLGPGGWGGGGGGGGGGWSCQSDGGTGVICRPIQHH